MAWWTMSLRTAYMEEIIPSNIYTLACSIALGGLFQGATGTPSTDSMPFTRRDTFLI